jgi:hypothetical protein
MTYPFADMIGKRLSSIEDLQGALSFFSANEAGIYLMELEFLG